MQRKKNFRLIYIQSFHYCFQVWWIFKCWNHCKSHLWV